MAGDAADLEAQGGPLARLAARFVPERFAQSRQSARHAHLVVYVAGVAAMFAFGLAALRFGLEGTQSTVGLILLAGGFGFAVSVLFLRWGRDPCFAGRAIPLVGITCLTSMAVADGGLHSEALFWVPFVPLVAVMTCGLVGAVVMTVLSVGALTGLAVLHDSAGLGWFEASSRAELLRLSGVAGATIFSGVVSWAYERGRLRNEERLRHLATHHPLTELPGRTLLSEFLERSLARSRRNQGSTGVAFVDLDEFKAVNDEFGHDVGDQLLCGVANRLREVTRTEEMPCHLSGDEFVIVVDDATDESMAALSDRVLEAFADPVAAAGRTFNIDLSIGVVTSTKQETAHQLLRRADASMYNVKRMKRAS